MKYTVVGGAVYTPLLRHVRVAERGGDERVKSLRRIGSAFSRVVVALFNQGGEVYLQFVQFEEGLGL